MALMEPRDIELLLIGVSALMLVFFITLVCNDVRDNALAKQQMAQEIDTLDQKVDYKENI